MEEEEEKDRVGVVCETEHAVSVSHRVGAWNVQADELDTATVPRLQELTDIEEMRKLIAAGADPTSGLYSHVAAYVNPSKYQANEALSLAHLELLIEEGADPNYYKAKGLHDHFLSSLAHTGMACAIHT